MLHNYENVVKKIPLKISPNVVDKVEKGPVVCWSPLITHASRLIVVGFEMPKDATLDRHDLTALLQFYNRTFVTEIPKP